MEAQFITVSQGARRVDAPDGEGYLKAIESGPSNGLPEGRYNLAEAIEAARDIGHEYHGHVLHKDAKHLFQLAGKEVIKHELTEMAAEQIPEIGKAIAVTYSGAGPHFDPLSIDGINTAAEQPPHKQAETEHGAAAMSDPRDEAEREYDYLMNAAFERTLHEELRPRNAERRAESANGRQAAADNGASPSQKEAQQEQQPQQQRQQQAQEQQQRQTEPQVADTARNEVRADLIELFTHDPQGIEKFVATEAGDMKGLLSGAKLQEIQGKMDRNIEYAFEMKSVHPDLFGKLADDALKAKVAAHERYDALAQKRDAGKGGKEADERERTQERERGNRAAVGSVRTSVEARVHETREVLARSAGLAPMVAVNAMKNSNNAQKAKGPDDQAKTKRGMSM